MRYLAAILIAAATAAVSGQGPSAGPVTLFEGATVIAGDGRAPVENAAFVVQGARITQVGRAGELRVPPGATRVDLGGKTVMPAIVDAHTHPPVERAALIDYLKQKASHGSSVAMSLGLDPGDVAFQMRQQPMPGAARLLTAGRGITTPEPGRSDVPYWITTAAEARKAVQELAAKRVDFVKIWVDDRGGKYKRLTPELYGPVIEEAHRHNLRVTAHVFYLEDAKGLLRAGVDAFAHGVRDKDVDDEFVALVRERPQVVLVPNLPPRANAESFGIQARNLMKLQGSGMKIAFGTDGGDPASHHQEMEDMVAAGMRPHDVIVAATRTSAQLLGLEDHGTIAPGQWADFLVLDASPLADISNTRKISAIYIRGAAVDRAAPPSQPLLERPEEHHREASRHPDGQQASSCAME